MKIDKDKIGVHQTHCCILHGCKYGQYDSCPVCIAAVKQEYLCESCDYQMEEMYSERHKKDKGDITYYSRVEEDDIWRKINNTFVKENRKLKMRDMKISSLWYIYMVRCSDDSIYTGITKDVERRLDEHNNSHKGAKYTKNRRPVFLILSFSRESHSDAAKEEYRLKKMSRTQKEEFIRMNGHLRPEE